MRPVPTQAPVRRTDEPNDEELVMRAQDGDEAAFAMLYRRHAPVVARRLRRVIYQAADAEDLLQSTFLEAHRSLHRYRRELPLVNWLCGIAFQVTGRYLKARRRRRWLQLFGLAQPPEVPDDSGRGTEAQVAERQRVQALYRALDALPEKQRVAFALVELEGLDLASAGAMAGASDKTMWARVEAARRVIRQRLGETELSPHAGEDGGRDEP